jgi:hypothetical protein
MKIMNLYSQFSISLKAGIISGLFEEQFFNKLNSYVTNNIIKSQILRKTLFKNIKIENDKNDTNNTTQSFHQKYKISYKKIIFNFFTYHTYYNDELTNDELNNNLELKRIFFLSLLFSVSILSIASPAYSYINLNQGSLGIGASGILNEATTWICYRLAPATLTLGLIKGFYDIKQHKPDAARKAFITAAAGTGVMLAPTITSAVLGIVQSAGGATNGITIGAGNGASTVGQP